MAPGIFSSDIVVTRVDSVTFGESKTDMNYFCNRPHHALIYKVSGTMMCYCGTDKNNGVAAFSGNDIVYIPKGMTYRSQSCEFASNGAQNGKAGKYILINFDTLADYPAEEIFVARFENHSNLYSLFSKCADEWLFKDSAHLLSCKSYIYKILALMARALDGSDSETRKKLQPSLEYLRRKINDPSLDTEKIAAESGLSESQFRRLFKKIYLVSPTRYIISVRIGQAKDLLRADCSSPQSAGIAEIAREVGFTDAESFTKLFHREVGLTPSDYRDSRG